MKTVHVAVAVIENGNGELLIAKRPEHLHMGGFWEFPGGKVEADETVLQALQREIREEVALDVHDAQPMLQIPFEYPDKRVLLDVWRVTAFSGIACGCEGQVVQWVTRDALPDHHFPPANRAIVVALQLPQRLLVTGAFDSHAECLQRTQRAIGQSGIRLVMLRAHHLAPAVFAELAQAMAGLCHANGARLLLNAATDSVLGDADGLHLSAARLRACSERPVLGANQWLGASCHNAQALQQAVAIGVDYIVLSPVLPTASHPGRPTLGWDGFTDLLTACPVPVFAMGGMGDEHLSVARTAGAWGIAGISAWWKETSL